jgi:hypothetical protein
MKKIFKENETPIKKDNMMEDLQILWAMLDRTAPENDLRYLIEKIEKMAENFPTSNFKIVKIEGFNVYEKKIPWHKISLNSNIQKVMHPILHLETKDSTDENLNIVTIGYNKAQNFLSFRKNNDPLKFYNFKNNFGTSEIANEFQIIMRRLLR